MKHLLISILALLGVAFTASAQEPQNIPELPPMQPMAEEHVYTVAEVAPSFPADMGDLQQWVLKNRLWPLDVSDDEEGQVMVRFVVEKDGSISRPRVIDSMSDPFDMEAVTVVRKMPKWNPALMKGQPVRCYAVVVVPFHADEPAAAK